MATPLLATHRVRIPYDVPGLPTHNMHILCNAALDGGDPSGWGLTGRGPGAIGFQIAMNYFMPLMLNIFDGASNVGNPILEQFIAGAYGPVATASGGGVGVAGGNFVPAQQTSITLRVTSPLETVRIQVMEPSDARVAYYGKFVSEAAIPSVPLRNFVGAFTDTANTTSPYQWARNRGANFILAFLSVVFDQNERMKRKRGGS